MPPGRKAASTQAKIPCVLMSVVLFMMIIRPMVLHSSFLEYLANENRTPHAATGSLGMATNSTADRYAYVFYASDDTYACSALVNMARLQKTLPHNVDLVMIAFDNVSPSIREVATHRLGALVYNTSSFGEEHDMGFPIGGLEGTYRHCFLKFLAFLLPSETYRRLIMIDADSLVLRAPHHLFHLPDELQLAVPSAYWLRPTYVSVTNWFMSVRPSKEIYITLQKALHDIQDQGRKDVYDMDLLNEVFEKDITVLPPIYGLLNSEFGENNQKTFGSLDDLLEGKTSWAIHFSYGKPMFKSMDEVRQNSKAHVGHAALFDMWNTEAREICPSGTFPTWTNAGDEVV